MQKNAMECLVKAWKSAKATDDGLEKIGFNNTPCFEIAGNILDAIYLMLGEDTQTLHESFTYETLYNEDLSVEECADILAARCKSHFDMKVSDNVMNSVIQAAQQIGIESSAMIQLVLCEWALQHEILNKKIRTLK